MSRERSDRRQREAQPSVAINKRHGAARAPMSRELEMGTGSERSEVPVPISNQSVGQALLDIQSPLGILE
jgi:hypothetical protein